MISPNNVLELYQTLYQNVFQGNPGTVVALFLVAFSALWLSLRRSDGGKRIPPTAWALPIIGDFFPLIRSHSHYTTSDIYAKLMLKFREGVFGIRFFGLKVAVVYGKKNVKRVLMAENDGVPSGYLSATADALGKKGIMFLKGEEHRKQRALMAKAFTPAAIESYLPLIQRIAEKHVDRWIEMSAKEGRVKFSSVARDVIFEIATRAVLGLDLDDAEAKRVNELFASVLVATTTILKIIPPFGLWETGYTKGMKARAELLQILDRQIKKLEAELQSGSADKVGEANVLRLLLTARDDTDGSRISREQLLDHAMILYSGAFETSTSTMSTALYGLLCNELHVRKVQEEQRVVRERHGDRMTNEALADMKFLMAAVQEGVRMRPPAFNMLRKTERDFELEDGYVIPKGWIVFACARATHYGEFGFEAVEQGIEHMMLPKGFKPERWLGDTPPSQFFGFGAGVRLCLGMNLATAQIRVILATLFRKCEVEILDRDASAAESVFPLLKSGLPVKVMARR